MSKINLSAPWTIDRDDMLLTRDDVNLFRLQERPGLGKDAERVRAMIAAAPDMLAALRAVVTGSTGVIGEDSTGQEFVRLRLASLEAVRAAIVKAGG